jgi:asparagine synthase (glutamine-hydrolysing)
MLWNTPESKYETLPLEDNAYILTMDARIDNRDELMKLLDLPNRPVGEIGDSVFILAAYKKWGEACPKYLLGDFAFAIWDKKREQLFCARDQIGIKLFHYYAGDELFVFSNDLVGILAHPDIPKELDDEMVAKFLKWQGVIAERSTFFEKIKKLPPATTLTVSKRGMEEKVYWRIEECISIKYDSFEEYVKRLKELLDSAVTARLRSDFPVASHLSGGIDSSPIAVLTARKLKKMEKKLYAFNWVDIPEHDDKYEYEAWNFSRRIAAQEENIVHEEFSIDPAFCVKQYEEHNILLEGTMSYWEENYVQDAVQNLGCRTLISGWGGDEMISYSGRYYIYDLVSQGKIFKALKYAFEDKTNANLAWNRFTKYTLKEMIPGWLRRLIKSVINFKVNGTFKQKQDKPYWYKYLTKEFSDFMDTLDEEKFSPPAGIKNAQVYLYHHGHLHERIESWALSSFSHRFEYSYPLLDRRIIEFAIGIPEELFYQIRGRERRLIKSAVSDLLPSDIVWFAKPDEVKVNREMQRVYAESVKILQKVSQNRDYRWGKNRYLKEELIKDTLDHFDFKKSEITELGNIVVAIMLLNSRKKLDTIIKRGKDEKNGKEEVGYSCNL